MAGDERWGNLYLYGCTVCALHLIASALVGVFHSEARVTLPWVDQNRIAGCFRRIVPFGCAAAAMAKHEVYLLHHCGRFGAAAQPNGAMRRCDKLPRHRNASFP
jgi:hypothetical protein